MRLIKYLAHAGVASRRKSEELIRGGHVKIGGTVITDPAMVVPITAAVTVDGAQVHLEKFRYYVVHKPVGIISTAEDTHDRPTVMGLIEDASRLYPVGRLDADSSGVILLTNDGDLANVLLHPRYEVPKTYQVTVSGKITTEALSKLRKGVELDDGLTAPARVLPIKVGPRSSTFRITIREGRNRQVRRMGEAVGFPVSALKRVRFGPIRLGTLRPGEARQATVRELLALRALAPKTGRRLSSRRRPPSD